MRSSRLPTAGPCEPVRDAFGASHGHAVQMGGVSVMPLENRHEVLIDLATEADRIGYDGFFMPETWAFDMTVLLAEAAVRTGAGLPGCRRAARLSRLPSSSSQPRR